MRLTDAKHVAVRAAELAGVVGTLSDERRELWAGAWWFRAFSSLSGRGGRGCPEGHRGSPCSADVVVPLLLVPIKEQHDLGGSRSYWGNVAKHTQTWKEFAQSVTKSGCCF